MAKFSLGINLCFATNRYVEPDEWARIVSEELGLKRVQLISDILDPFWPQAVLDAEVKRILAATRRYDITIQSLMTGGHSRLNHFMHPYVEHREAWLAWFKRFADLAARLGSPAVGSHFGIMTFRDLEDPARYRERLADGVRAWQELSHYARAIGLKYVYFETMSVPREAPDTIECARELLARVNSGADVPVRLCLDAGHAPHPSQRDPYRWLRELGRDAPMVHVHQTDANHSRHWPFVDEYNAVGIIDPPRVLAAINESGAAEVDILFEILHREVAEQEGRIVADLKASVAYWRRWVPVDGAEWPRSQDGGDRQG